MEDFADQLPRSFYIPEVAPPGKISRNPYLDDLFDALVLGLRDYVEKVGVFERMIVALSGGRDSALCLLLAVEATKSFKEGLEAEKFARRVSTIYLPTAKYSSKGTGESRPGPRRRAGCFL